MGRFPALTAVLLVMTAASPARGAAPEDDEAPGGKTVVVAKSVPEDPVRSDRAVTLLDAQALAEGAPRTTPEALWETPGVFVQATNRGGGSPIIRGLVGPQVLLLVDGVRLNNSVFRPGPVQYLHLVDAFSLDRIEVLRGPGSVLYGSDAMGGVVSMHLADPVDCRADPGGCAAGALRGRYSSADEGGAVHGRVSGGVGGFGAMAGGTFQTFGDLNGGGDVGRQSFTGYKTYSALAKVVHRFSLGSTVGGTVAANWMFSRIEDAGRTDAVAAGSLRFTDNDLHLGWARLTLRMPTTRAEVTLSYQDFREEVRDLALASDRATTTGLVRDRVTDRTLGSDLRLTTRLVGDRLRLQYGGMYYHDWVDAARAKVTGSGAYQATGGALYPDGSTFHTYGAYARLEGDPISTADGHVLRLSGGYRLHGMGGTAPAIGIVPPADWEALGHVGQAGVQWLWRDRTTLAVTWSEGFRAPNLQEAVMFGDSGRYYNVPNPDLGAERSDTVEVLGRIQVWRLRFAASGWVTFLTDLIDRVPGTWDGQSRVEGKDVLVKVNVGKAFLWGVEAEGTVDMGWGLSAGGNLSYTRGDQEVTGKPDVPLSRIPPLFGTARLRWDVPWPGPVGGFVEAYVRAAARQDRLSPLDLKDSRIPKGGTPSWATLNLRGGVTVSQRVHLGLALENLTNATYKHHGSGVWMPGFNAVLSAGVDM
jgi:outer membrane receptor protein involved in Fe transport